MTYYFWLGAESESILYVEKFVELINKRKLSKKPITLGDVL